MCSLTHFFSLVSVFLSFSRVVRLRLNTASPYTGDMEEPAPVKKVSIRFDSHFVKHCCTKKCCFLFYLTYTCWWWWWCNLHSHMTVNKWTHTVHLISDCQLTKASCHSFKQYPKLLKKTQILCRSYCIYRTMLWTITTGQWGNIYFYAVITYRLKHV